MARPSRRRERRAELVPVLAATFAELGYRRTTTAELAGRCGVQETILYRLWPDKRAMFVAALDHVYEVSETTWKTILDRTKGRASPAEVLLDYESSHHGEFGLYRVIFAGLSETDDGEVADALRRLYGRFQRFVRAQVTAHRDGARAGGADPDPGLTAWALVGLGTVANIGNELGLLSARARRRLFGDLGRVLLGRKGG